MFDFMTYYASRATKRRDEMRTCYKRLLGRHDVGRKEVLEVISHEDGWGRSELFLGFNRAHVSLQLQVVPSFSTFCAV